MNNIRLVAVVLATVVAAVLLGASIYDSVVLAPNLKGGPAALEHARGFMHAATPANLFRVLSPLHQVAIALAMVLVWTTDRKARWALMVALICAVAGDILTFQFHYPRNYILFAEPLTRPVAEFDRVAEEWAAGNYCRIGLVVTSVTCGVISLVRIARQTGVRVA